MLHLNQAPDSDETRTDLLVACRPQDVRVARTPTPSCALGFSLSVSQTPSDTNAKEKKSSDAVFVSLPGSTHLSPDHPKMRQIFGTYFRSSALPSFVTVARKPTTPIEQEIKESSESYTEEEEMPLEEFLARGATPFEDRRKETF